MIRFLEENDLKGVQLIAQFQLNEIDLDYSAIDIDENGHITSMILTSAKALIKVFPDSKFPHTRQCKVAFPSYNENNNHKIVFLYKTDKNGKSLSDTFYFLLNKIKPRGNHWWWLNKEDLNLDSEFNKIRPLLCPIDNTPYFYSI